MLVLIVYVEISFVLLILVCVDSISHQLMEKGYCNQTVCVISFIKTI